MHRGVPLSRPPTVLIASEQEWSSRSLESVLEPHGYVVFRAYTGGGALERARNDQPDAIIIDVHLPDADGWDVCRQLRAREIISDSTPILITLSAWPTRQDRLHAWRTGIWECLGQPLDVEEFLATLGVFVRAKLDADRARAFGLVDEATGLYNARGLMRRAQELGAQAARQRAPLGCVLFAPDFGPEDAPAGAVDAEPAALPRIAQAFRSSGRLSDVIGRPGPLEFAVVALGTDAQRARQLGERLASSIRTARPLRLHAGCYGVTDFQAASIDAMELVQRATVALRSAQSDRTGPWLRSFDEVGDGATAPKG